MMRINTTGYGHYRRVSEKSAQSGVGVCASECDRASEKGGREGLAEVKYNEAWDAWVAQSVKHPTLDFGSGHDLRIVG